MTPTGRLLLCLLALGAGVMSPARAAGLAGKVVSVDSGDTVTVEDRQGVQHRVRLHAIAAPEPRQAFADESRRALGKLLQGKRVVVETLREDAYGRSIGKLLTAPAHCGTCPPSRDAGLAQLEAGLAWWYREERREQTLHDQGYYEYAEFDARTRRLGLWRDEAPVSPWEWRKGRGLEARRPDNTKPVAAGAGTGFFALAGFVLRPQAGSQIGAAPAGRSPEATGLFLEALIAEWDSALRSSGGRSKLEAISLYASATLMSIVQTPG